MNEITDAATADGLEILRRSVDEAFQSDWEFDVKSGMIRRRAGASTRRHAVWALYRWLIQRYHDTPDLRKFRMPMAGDNMPAVPGSPRKWEWTSDVLRINEPDLAFLSAGPLVNSAGRVLVDAAHVGASPTTVPQDREQEVAECESDWKFVPGSHEIHRRDGASSATHRVEALYWVSRRFAGSEDGIVFDDPMDRDPPIFSGVPRRYWTCGQWKLRIEDSAHLSDGPLFSEEALVVPQRDAESARRIYVEDIDSFSAVKEIDPSQVSIALDRGFLDLYEKDIKGAIHKIVGEPHIRKDHGAERSDVFADIVVGGRRVQAAFALKGKSGGRKVTISKFGTNGDQVVRLFEEPAELFVVQATGVFESTFVKHVGQTAEALKRPIAYCLIDGRDTARILTAYAEVLGRH